MNLLEIFKIVRILCVVVVIVFIIYYTVLDAKYYFAIKRAERVAVIGSSLWVTSLIFSSLPLVIFMLIDGRFSAFYILFILYLQIKYLPLFTTAITPEGVISRTWNNVLIPPKDYLYEYKKTEKGECLNLHRNGMKTPSSCDIGIRKPETVEILEEYYFEYSKVYPNA